jgi:hypothetical protein
MDFAVLHDRTEETPEAKARWFQQLSFEERGELLCSFTEMILELNPQVAELKDAKPVAGRVHVLRAA